MRKLADCKVLCSIFFLARHMQSVYSLGLILFLLSVSVCLLAYFRGEPIFVIFMVNLQVTKFSTPKLMIGDMRYTTSSRLGGAKSTFTMALFRYLYPVDNAPDPWDPLSQAVPCAVINEKAEPIMTRPVPSLTT